MLVVLVAGVELAQKSLALFRRGEIVFAHGSFFLSKLLGPPFVAGSHRQLGQSMVIA
jgi:hypothetical protein